MILKSKTVDRLNAQLCKDLAHAKGIITVCQGYEGLSEDYGYALQSAIDLIARADDAAAELGKLAGAS